jgi:hypothetical protein
MAAFVDGEIIQIQGGDSVLTDKMDIMSPVKPNAVIPPAATAATDATVPVANDVVAAGK